MLKWPEVELNFLRVDYFFRLRLNVSPTNLQPRWFISFFSSSFICSCVLYGVPFQASQFAPILAIILINFVIFILAMRALSRTGALVSAEKKSTSYQRARTSIAILLLLGLTWAFGALAISRAQIVFDYLFCIFNSLQGFLIFYFHCLRQQEVRNQWKTFLSGKGLRVQRTETDSRTGYPKTISKGHKYEAHTPTTSVAMHDYSLPRKETVTHSEGDSSPRLQLRPDVVPAEVWGLKADTSPNGNMHVIFRQDRILAKKWCRGWEGEYFL